MIYPNLYTVMRDLDHMVKLRYQEVSDAERYFEILSCPEFEFFEVNVKSVEEEREWLEKNAEKREKNLEYNYAIIYRGEVAGACGVAIDQRREHIGEIGYFIHKELWGRGIATEAVKQLERIVFEEIGLVRLEIRMEPENKASEKVAKKCGYEKEGLVRKAYKRDGEYRDCLLYSKVDRCK